MNKLFFIRKYVVFFGILSRSAFLFLAIFSFLPNMSFAQIKKQPSQNQAGSGAAPTSASSEGQAFLINSFDDWKALTAGQGKQKLCYALSQPKERLPAKLVRDPGYVFITNRLSDGVRNEIAFKLGFKVKHGQEGALNVGSSVFAIVGSDDTAFLKNQSQEAQVIEAIKRAGAFSTKISSLRGNETTDKYSTKGFAKSLEAIAKECP